MNVPARMCAVLTTGHGGLEKLEYREDVATPEPAAGEVLIRVGACGMNNTDRHQHPHRLVQQERHPGDRRGGCRWLRAGEGR